MVGLTNFQWKNDKNCNEKLEVMPSIIMQFIFSQKSVFVLRLTTFPFAFFDTFDTFVDGVD